MASDSAPPPVIGAIADDRDGNALGTITAVFLDDVTERPTWVGLTDGLHATSGDVSVIAPISGAEFADGRLRLTVSADAVRTAPPMSQPDRLSPAEELVLREHYRAAAATSQQDPSADGGMTRSEEQLQVSMVVEPWARAVLRIEEVTEEVLVPVTITRQQARIEYLPLATADDAGTAGGAAPPGTERSTSTTGWVTLWSEQPAVTLERVPVERVRLRTAWATEETAVSAELRREQVELTETPRA
ncbi:MAG: uncharacterized protein JWR45_1888 [Blastococcus sp.]|nr:uncharacterized protein [Blastococcus sp.]